LDDDYRNVVIIPQNAPQLLDRTLEADAQIGQVIFEPSGGSWGRVPARSNFAEQVDQESGEQFRVGKLNG